MRKILPVTGILMASLAVGACGRDAETRRRASELPLGRHAPWR